MELIQVNDSTIWARNLPKYNYSLFFLPEFLESVKDSFESPVYFDIVEEGNALAKISGLAVQRRYLFRSRLHFYAGPATLNVLSNEQYREIFHLLIAYARSNRYSRIIVNSYDYLVELPRMKWYKSNTRSEYVIDIKRAGDDIKKIFSRNIIRQSKKASQKGFILKESRESKYLEQLIALLEETRTFRLKKGYTDYEYFYLARIDKDSLRRLIESGLIHFSVVEKDGKVYAIQASLMNEGKAYTLYVGVNQQGYQEGVPSFLDYNLIILLSKRGFKTINFGGIPTEKSHQGLIEFKKKLGAKQIPSRYGNTNFLVFPLSLLNPILNLLRFLPNVGPVKILRNYIR
jgi:hypothetical protein